MIVRILDEGQYEVNDATFAELERLDTELNAAFDAGEDRLFETVLAQITSLVRSDGKALDASRLVPSDLTVPNEGSTIDDVRRMLAYGETEEL